MNYHLKTISENNLISKLLDYRGLWSPYFRKFVSQIILLDRLTERQSLFLLKIGNIYKLVDKDFQNKYLDELTIAEEFEGWSS